MNKHFLYILRFFSKGWDVSALALLPFLQKESNLSLIEIGLLAMVFGVTATISSLVAGHVSEHLGNKNVLFFTLLFYILSWGGFLITHSFFVYCLVYACAGISSGLLEPITSAIFARESSATNRAQEMGDFAAFGDLGRISLTTLTTILIGFISLQLVSVMYAGIAVMLLVFLISHSLRKNIKLHKIKKTRAVSLLTLASSRKYVMAVITGMLDSFSSSSLFIFLPFLFMQKGIDIKITGLFTALFFLGYLSGRLVLGRLGDKHGTAKIFMFAQIIMAFLIIGLVYIQSFWLIVIDLFLLGVVTRGTSPLVKAMIADGLKENEFEKGYSLHASTGRISSSLSRPAFGYMGTLWGVASIFYFSGAIALLTIIPAWLFYTSKD